MIKEQTATLVKGMGKSGKFKRCRAAESDQGSDDEEINNNNNNNNNNGDTHKNNGSNGNSDGDSCNDSGPYTWIGTWIQKPKGERYRQSQSWEQQGMHRVRNRKTIKDRWNHCEAVQHV